MLTALFADIHANLAALQACLRDARARGAGRFVFLGDLVGYGPDPAAVVELIRSIDGAVVVKGNHDHAVEIDPRARDLDDVAYRVLTFTRQALSPEQRRFLANLPLIVRERELCFVHASANEPRDFEYVESAAAAESSMNAAGTPYVFSGHVHDQTLYFSRSAGKTASFVPTSGSVIPAPRHRSWLAIVGSVGQPRDQNPAAAYATFDDLSRSITFFRVPYDHRATIERLRDARLPEALAARLQRGE